MTVAHQLGSVPLILKAEGYEEAAASAEGSTMALHAGHQHEHGDEGWKPRDGFERTAFTGLADVVTGIGFALLLVAGFALSGRAVGWREGLLWGLAGFVVFTLAPSLGLSPEPPGVPVAPLTARQVWWASTAASTAARLGLLAFRRTPVAAVAALVLLALPHLIGAPPLPEAGTLVPASLAHEFAVAVLLTSFGFWALLGSAAALCYGRLVKGNALGSAAVG